MKDAFTMWKNTKMIVLTAICAALYTALLLPFKAIVIIPGLTELRPASALPPTFSILFGPAAAWGSAIGNLVGDFLGGTLGWGSIFGFFGNFLYGYIPYRLFKQLKHRESLRKRDPFYILLSVILASVTCGLFIGWGVDFLGIFPFAALANIITINNILVAGILTPIIVLLLTRRIFRWKLHYSQCLGEKTLKRPKTFIFGLTLLLIGSIGGIILGNYLSLGIMDYNLFLIADIENLQNSLILGLSLIPSIVMIIVGSIFI